MQDARKIMNHQLVTTLHLPAGTEIVPDSTLLNEEVTALAENDWQMIYQSKQCRTATSPAGYENERAESEIGTLGTASEKLHLCTGEHLDGPITIEVPVLDNNFNYWYVGVGIKYNLSSLFKTTRKCARQN